MAVGTYFPYKGHLKYKAVLNQSLSSTWSFKSLEIPLFKAFTYNRKCMQIFGDVKLVMLCIITLDIIKLQKDSTLP